MKCLLIPALLGTLHLAQCGQQNPPVYAQPRTPGPIQIGPPPVHFDACGSGVHLSTVGRIYRKNPNITRVNYGTHVVVDEQGQVVWVMDSSRVPLDSYAENGRPYQVEGYGGNGGLNHLIVCQIFNPQQSR